MKKTLILAAASACVFASVSVQAALNLVSDPGFEGSELGNPALTGSPWINPNYNPPFSLLNNVTIAASNPHSGNNAAQLTEAMVNGMADSAYLAQSISLTAGSPYAVSFWAMAPISTTGSLTVTLNGMSATQGPLGISGTGVYTEYSYTVDPMLSSGFLYFIWTGSTTGASAYLDDVSVTPVPEPTTMIAGALMLLPFAASTFRPRKKQAR
jgi:hypothetical protein